MKERRIPRKKEPIRDLKYRKSRKSKKSRTLIQITKMSIRDLVQLLI